MEKECPPASERIKKTKASVPAWTLHVGLFVSLNFSRRWNDPSVEFGADTRSPGMLSPSHPLSNVKAPGRCFETFGSLENGPDLGLQQQVNNETTLECGLLGGCVGGPGGLPGGGGPPPAPPLSAGPGPAWPLSLFPFCPRLCNVRKCVLEPHPSPEGSGGIRTSPAGRSEQQLPPSSWA